MNAVPHKFPEQLLVKEVAPWLVGASAPRIFQAMLPFSSLIDMWLHGRVPARIQTHQVRRALFLFILKFQSLVLYCSFRFYTVRHLLPFSIPSSRLKAIIKNEDRQPNPPSNPATHLRCLRNDSG
jgi:hypothetical protein